MQAMAGLCHGLLIAHSASHLSSTTKSATSLMLEASFLDTSDNTLRSMKPVATPGASHDPSNKDLVDLEEYCRIQ